MSMEDEAIQKEGEHLIQTFMPKLAEIKDGDVLIAEYNIGDALFAESLDEIINEILKIKMYYTNVLSILRIIERRAAVRSVNTGVDDTIEDTYLGIDMIFELLENIKPSDLFINELDKDFFNKITKIRKEEKSVYKLIKKIVKIYIVLFESVIDIFNMYLTKVDSSLVKDRKSGSRKRRRYNKKKSRKTKKSNRGLHPR
jgi:hypothetical protein